MSENAQGKETFPMEISLDWTPGTRIFTGQDDKGNTLKVDGHREEGVSPSSTLLFSLGSCSGVDMGHILGRMKQEVKSMRIEVRGDREDVGGAKPWRKMHMIFHLTGDLDPKKVDRAMKLSLEKYCSVALTLTGVEITGEYKIS